MSENARSNVERVVHYRREAREIQARAAAMADAQKRAQLLEISEACDRLADHLERYAAKSGELAK